MAWYSVLLRRQRYPYELNHLVIDFEMANVQGKWAVVFSKFVKGKLAPNVHQVWLNNSRWEPIVQGEREIPLYWTEVRQANIALLQQRQFPKMAQIREFIEDIMLDDIEFYVVSTDLNGEFQQGHAWYGVVSRGNVEFDDFGPVHKFIQKDT